MKHPRGHCPDCGERLIVACCLNCGSRSLTTRTHDTP